MPPKPTFAGSANSSLSLSAMMSSPPRTTTLTTLPTAGAAAAAAAAAGACGDSMLSDMSTAMHGASHTSASWGARASLALCPATRLLPRRPPAAAISVPGWPHVIIKRL